MIYGFLLYIYITFHQKPQTDINTTQGDNKFTNNQHYHYLQQKTMSNVSDNEEEAPPPTEAEVVDDNPRTLTTGWLVNRLLQWAK